MSEKYLEPVPGARWAISRRVGGTWIHLVQDSHLDSPTDAHVILGALGIPATAGNLDYFFPERPGQGRCPTLELLERCNMLDPTNPLVRKKREYGV